MTHHRERDDNVRSSKDDKRVKDTIKKEEVKESRTQNTTGPNKKATSENPEKNIPPRKDLM